MEKFRTALVIPPATLQEQYGSLAKAAPELPPLGIAFIAKFLEQNGFQVDLFDFSVDHPGLAGFLDQVRDYAVVGMPAYITTAPNVINFAREIKRRSPGVTVVAGGPHATLFPEDFFRDCIDLVVVGEGESPLLGVLRRLSGEQGPGPIPGVWERNGDGFQAGGVNDLFNRLDEVDAPAVEKFNLQLYRPPIHVAGRKVVHTLTTRGCPFSCRFCAATEIFKRRVRFRDENLVFEELLGYRRQGVDSILFYDDSFTINKKRTMRLCQRMIEERLGMDWMCFTRTDLVDPELLKIMKKAGCYLITFGCESGNEKTLKLLNKKLTVQRNLDGIRMTHEAGIMAASTFMLGLPGEDLADIERTISFALRSELTCAYFPIFEPYKGTPIYELCKTTGQWISDQRYKNSLLEFQDEIWVPNGVARGDIESAAKRAFAKFYLRPKVMRRLASHFAMRLPLERQLRFVNSGLYYFIGSRLKPQNKRRGSRY